MEPGLYVTFFSGDEPANRELPAVGPLYNVVLRHKSLVAERRMVMQAQELGVSIDRWLEAELEMQRATGEEAGGTKRSERRISARDGVFLRFAVFGEAHERDVAPELGPFSTVVVGPGSVEADGRVLATRVASDLAPWQLTSGAGDALDGTHKPDIAFRTSNTSYHPSITPAMALPPRAVAPEAAPTPVAPTTPAAGPVPTIPSEPVFAVPPRAESGFSVPPAAEPFFTPPPRTEQVIRPTPRSGAGATPAADGDSSFVERPRRQTEVYSARGETPPLEGENLTPGDVELIARLDQERNDETLRARIQEGERRRLGVNEQANDEATAVSMRYRAQAAAAEPVYEGESRFEWGPALWRMRFAIIGVMVLMVAGYAFIVLRTGTAPTVSGEQVKYVGIAQRFSGTGWEFVVNGVQRAPTAGTARARGLYYVVRIGATNKGADSQQLSPSNFTLVDANGTEYGPESPSSGAYQGPENPGSPFVWPASFASGKTVSFSVIFDVDPSLPRGMLLKMSDPPGVRVRLD